MYTVPLILQPQSTSQQHPPPHLFKKILDLPLSRMFPYLADSKVEPHVNDNKHEEQVECANNKKRLL